MYQKYIVMALGVVVLCTGLVCDASVAYSQSFILKSTSSTTSSRTRVNPRGREASPVYSGGVVVSPKFKSDNTKTLYHNRQKQKSRIVSYGSKSGQRDVYMSDRMLKEKKKKEEEIEYKRRVERRDTIREKMKIRNDAKMAKYYEEQKAKAKQELREKNSISRLSGRKPPKSHYYKKSVEAKKTR